MARSRSAPANVPIAALGLLATAWLVPDSKNPASRSPDLAGAALSMAGIAMIVGAVIEAPARGWSSPLVIGPAAGGLAVLAVFAAWERVTAHPMLNLSLFRQRRFAAAIPAVVTLTFGLFGALFVLTQFLQFALGFTPLQASIRILPVAVAVGATFAAPAAGMVLLGAGAGLALPTATGAVIASVPTADSGVASAADTTAIQLGGALGVAVIGSLLAIRYRAMMAGALAGQHLPGASAVTARNSLGGALAVAGRAGGVTGPLLTHLAKTAFAGGMLLGLLTGAVIAAAGCLLALLWFPAASRPLTRHTRSMGSTSGRGGRRHAGG